jgi:molybdopterin-containing oxidoreductase family membrane subunit
MNIRYQQIKVRSLGFYALIAGLGIFILAALGSVHIINIGLSQFVGIN